MERARVEYLFVYGTLRQGAGHPMHRILARHAVPLGKATWQGRLYRIGWYPGAVASNSPGDLVHGEVFRLHRPRLVLPPLDRFENCGPGMPQPTEFERRRYTVRLSNGSTLSAWIYVYNLPVANRMRIAGGDFLARRRRRAA
jgi:gamma-glutamylcyclotransferase (GGCT)/AIG2-like uncharacterized protein YtfP